MKPYKWQIINSGYRYVDSRTGSDLKGDGTMDNPYKTLRRAWDATTEKPGTIICRGYFSEDMADGNHAAAIRGDYMGAATFDGNDTFLIYGFYHSNLIIKNCAHGSNDFTVSTGSGLLAGAGRALSAGTVGRANSVNGVAGSPVIFDRTGVYYGVLGGTSAVSFCVFSRIKNNSTYPLSLNASSDGLQNNTYYGARITNRQKRIYGSVITLYNSIFADFDLFADESDTTFQKCLFLADCKWYYNGAELVISGTTSSERESSLIAEMDAAGVPVADRPTFVDCIFSTQVSTDVFNNPEKVDFTLKINSDAVLAAGVYLGAMPPALNVPIMDDSSQVKETWDENSAAGCLAVSGNAIAIDELSASETGEILSKVLRFNPSEINVNAIFADFASKFTGFNSYLWDEDLMGVHYTSADQLPVGRYKVKGSIVYDGENYGDGAILVIDQIGTSFTDTNSHSEAIEILDANISNVVYVRELPYIFVRIQSTDGLQQGATYFNYDSESITYRGRTIVQGESFVADNSVDTFTASSGYEIGVMFDDTRVPSAQWVPAQLFGEYFVWKQGGAIQLDADGVPVSSGNYLSFQTTANGGYSDQLIKTILTTAYCQFKIVVKRFNIT